MRSVIRATPKPAPGQLMHLVSQGVRYRLSIEYATHQQYDAGEWRHYRPAQKGHVDDFYHFTLYTGGRNTFLHDGQVWPCQRGTLACTSPGQVHQFWPRRWGEMVYRQLTLAWYADDGTPLRLPVHRVLEAYMGLPMVEVAYPKQLDRRTTARVEHLLTELLAALFDRQQYMAHACSLVLRLFDVLLTRIYALEPHQELTDPLTEARQYIDQYFYKKLKVPELARIAGWSTGYFQRAFRRRFGLTPIHYQQQVRVEAAKTLLRSTDHTLAQIAEATGFCDEYHLNHVFRQQVGLPPGRFRRQAG